MLSSSFEWHRQQNISSRPRENKFNSCDLCKERFGLERDCGPGIMTQKGQKINFIRKLYRPQKVKGQRERRKAKTFSGFVEMKKRTNGKNLRAFHSLFHLNRKCFTAFVLQRTLKTSETRNLRFVSMDMANTRKGCERSSF